jgi:hypothetical protein
MKASIVQTSGSSSLPSSSSGPEAKQRDGDRVTRAEGLRSDLAEHQQQQGDHADRQTRAEVPEMFGGDDRGKGGGAGIHQVVADQDDHQRAVEVALHPVQRAWLRNGVRPTAPRRAPARAK